MNVFDPMINISTITLVGCGGTGGQVARTIARIVYDMKQRRMHTPKIRLIDPDIVEMKNTGRQLFVPNDCGKNKAEALGLRFNRALGLDIEWITEPVNAKKHFDRHSSNLVIDAVDNYEARREIYRIPGAIIHSGNHHFEGQICIGNISDRDFMLRHIDGDNGKYRHLPNAALLFPQLLEPEVKTDPIPEPISCTESVIEGSQHLMVNDLVSCVAGQYLYKLLHRIPIGSFLSYVSVDTMTVRSIPIEKSELLAYLQL
jgi:PRTRC genetic system ThiF family protein